MNPSHSTNALAYRHDGEKENTMKTFKVGFQDGCIFSINMIWANTGREEYEAVKETAERRAKRYGYEIAFITEIPDHEVESNLRKGMPMYPIDDEAERAHDPSFQGIFF